MLCTTRYDFAIDKIVDNLEVGGRDSARPEDLLRAAIVSGKLQPNQRLVEADLTLQLGVGRSAVRTALARLEQEGLVELERHRGARVRLVTHAEAVEILEARAALEGLAARHAATRARPTDVSDLYAILDEMRRCVDGGDLLGASDRNADLHRRLVQIADQRIVENLISTLRSQLVRFQYRTILLSGRSERSLSEHTAIFAAVANADGEAAEHAMRLHLSNVADALLRQEASS